MKDKPLFVIFYSAMNYCLYNPEEMSGALEPQTRALLHHLGVREHRFLDIFIIFSVNKKYLTF